jgi:hypothetical protein
MLRLSPKLFWVGIALAASVLTGYGFSPAGPTNSEPYQTPEIGYQLPGDIVTPKNLGEEYRRTTPVLYYYVDSNFRDYFGSNGVYALQQAISVYNSISNASQYSPNLTEVPLQAQRENYLAEALFLTDMKSFTMALMAEQMGLAEPERYTWGLHDRLHVGNVQCPVGQEYTIVQRNFDPVTSLLNQFQTSSYVNGTLYSYYIAEFCDPPVPPDALAVPFKVDPLDLGYTSIAGGLVGALFGQDALTSGLVPGKFWTGMTRDDIAGIRYLLTTNHINFEGAGSNTLTYVTNFTPQILYSSNLTLLASAALTNDPVTLEGLFPGLTVVASSNYFVNINVTNVTPYFTNFPWDPVGTPARLVFSTNLVPVVQTRYYHTFDNVFTSVYTSSGWALVPLINIPPDSTAFVTIQTDTAGFGGNPWGPAGATILTTNSTFTTYQTNSVVGDYFILSNGLCSAQIIASQLTNVTTFTNFLGSVTNNLVVTNGSGITAGTTLTVSFNQINYYTNHAFVILPVNCATNAVAWREGIDKVSFVKLPDNALDELTYSLYQPITNDYTITAYDPTNNVVYPQRNRRITPFADFIFSARDLADVPGNNTIGTTDTARNLNFINSTTYGVAYQGLGGPGTIEPGTFFIYNKVGPIFANFWPNSESLEAQALQSTLFIWGSFDGTTNLPVVYPNGTTIANLENQFLIQILPTSLPDATVNSAYSASFTANGGQSPYRWSLSPTSAGLPPGLTLTWSGAIFGTPTQDGTFDFVIQMKDAANRTVDYNYSITINP